MPDGEEEEKGPAVAEKPTVAPTSSAPVDHGDGRAYVVSPELGLAVDVALATDRPLLLRGAPGSGKSSFAAHVAWERGWRYYEHVVTSRTQAEDLLWTYDHVRRLGDAQAQRLADTRAYVEPGVLWWAFDSASARTRGRRPDAGPPADVAAAREPYAEINATRSPRGTVVLVDEIDKADPDLPNGLLVPLGSGRFQVTQTGDSVQRCRPDGAGDAGEGDDGGEGAALLIVVTTNEERELPGAFLRRCLSVTLPEPTADKLVEVAACHLETYGTGWDRRDLVVARALAGALVAEREKAEHDGTRPPSTAEFLDAFQACRRLEVTESDPRWEMLVNMALLKRTDQW
ncbi:AAA family ATPase [Streptomyces sp. NPDC017936]|uniref:AAA family ATPase n=1 Tax=Streptomyces sp. NPDC017936 TaxID=3365016 RepID=UPI0037B8A415